MTSKDSVKKIEAELQKAVRLVKCRKCGCMKQALESICSYFCSLQTEGASELLESAQTCLKQMEPIEYPCFGCDYCFAAVATNILNQAFPEAIQGQSLSCDFEQREQTWPVVPGEYFVVSKEAACPVAVSTLASIELAESLAQSEPEGLCIVGKTETENIGIDKVIKNTVTNPTIKFLIVSGKDPQGHHSGQTLLALSEKGVDEDMKVIDAPGRHPILKNVSPAEVESFRKQVQVIDMIGCENTEKIIDKINELSRETISTCECKECSEPISPIQISITPKILAGRPKKLKMDRGGYFVVIPSLENKIIIVEHYAYDNKLLHIIEGKDAPSIYLTIIENGWITELNHAAYLGKELAKAELSLKNGFKYIQDKAAGKVEDNRK